MRMRELELLKREHALERQRIDAVERMQKAHKGMTLLRTQRRKVWLIASMLRAVARVGREAVAVKAKGAPQSARAPRTNDASDLSQVSRDRLASLLLNLVLENKTLLDRSAAGSAAVAAALTAASPAAAEELDEIERKFSHASPLAARTKPLAPIPARKISSELLVILTRAPRAESDATLWKSQIAALLDSDVFSDADQSIARLEAAHAGAMRAWRARVLHLRGRAPRDARVASPRAPPPRLASASTLRASNLSRKFAEVRFLLFTIPFYPKQCSQLARSPLHL